MKTNQLIRLLFHLLPLAPLWWGHFFLLAAGILLVVLPYIKVVKMTTQLATLTSMPGAKNDCAGEIIGLKNARDRWQALTFLPEWRRWRDGK